jgi:DNA-binding MarR family transcriptional regulator
MMERLLIDFINTLDLSLKNFQEELGVASGVLRLTINQFRYIDAINELGEPKITDIANRLNITKASVTTGINKLIQSGYVKKTRSTVDKRVFHVCLSDAGGRLIKAKYQALKDYGDFISAALTEDEARQFEAILTKLVKLFEHAE